MCALKLFFNSKSSVQTLFGTEADVHSKINHPSILEYVDSFSVSEDESDTCGLVGSIATDSRDTLKLLQDI